MLREKGLLSMHTRAHTKRLLSASVPSAECEAAAAIVQKLKAENHFRFTRKQRHWKRKMLRSNWNWSFNESQRLYENTFSFDCAHPNAHRRRRFPLNWNCGKPLLHLVLVHLASIFLLTELVYVLEYKYVCLKIPTPENLHSYEIHTFPLFPSVCLASNYFH